MNLFEAKKLLKSNGYNIIKESKKEKTQDMIEKLFSYAQNALLQALLNVDLKYVYLYSESNGITFSDITVNETVTFKFRSMYIVEPAADIIRDFISDYEYENQDVKITVMRVDDKTNTITVRFTTDTVDYSVEEF